MKRDDDAQNWWKIILGSSAVFVGAALYLGYSFLRFQLISFGYDGPLFSIYGNEDLLMEGVNFTFKFIAPRLFIASLCAGSFIWVFKRQIQKHARLIMGILFSLYAIFALSFYYLPNDMHRTWYFYLFNHRDIVIMLLLFMLAFASLQAIIMGTQQLRIPLWSIIVMLGWIFFLWIAPQLLSFTPDFPRAKLSYVDGSVKKFYYITQHADCLIVCDIDNRHIHLIPEKNIADIEILGFTRGSEEK